MMATTAALPVPTILKFLNDINNNDNYMMDQNVGAPQRAKKRRLDHLSWEEKMQRKKLKNRVAAQTSRDRKKQKLEQMETAIQQLFMKNETLLTECEKLKAANERLQAENAELRQEMQTATPCQTCQNRPVVCASESGSTESLLRPKGTGAHTAAALTNEHKVALLKMVLACLLCQTYSTNLKPTSTSTPWNSLRSRCSKISPEIWRALLKRQLIKNRPLIKKLFLEKWWGRHQNNWNPVELKC